MSLENYFKELESIEIEEEKDLDYLLDIDDWKNSDLQSSIDYLNNHKDVYDEFVKFMPNNEHKGNIIWVIKDGWYGSFDRFNNDLVDTYINTLKEFIKTNRDGYVNESFTKENFPIEVIDVNVGNDTDYDEVIDIVGHNTSIFVGVYFDKKRDFDVTKNSIKGFLHPDDIDVKFIYIDSESMEDIDEDEAYKRLGIENDKDLQEFTNYIKNQVLEDAIEYLNEVEFDLSKFGYEDDSQGPDWDLIAKDRDVD